MLTLCCCIAVAAVLGAVAPLGIEQDHAPARVASSVPAGEQTATERIPAALRKIRAAQDAFMEEQHGDLACGFGTPDGEWFDWQRLRRNDPFPFPLFENSLANFGISVAVSGDIAIVGSSRQVLLIPNPTDPDNPIELLNSGAAYIFRYVDGQWARVAKIQPPLSTVRFRPCEQIQVQYINNIRFGSAVAAAASPDREIVVIGAPFEPFLLMGEDGEPDDPQPCVNGALPLAGAVYVYERIGGRCASPPCAEQWVPMAGVSENYHQGTENPQLLLDNRLWNNFPFEGSRFGASVAIKPFRRTELGWVGGDRIAAGAPTSVAFPNCEEAGNPGWFSGTISTFKFGGTNPLTGKTFPFRWVMGDSLTAECFPFDQFGTSVAIGYSNDRQKPTILSGLARGIAWVPDPNDPKEELPIFEAGTVLLYEYDPSDDDEDDDNGDNGGNGNGDDDEQEMSWKLTDAFQSINPRQLELFGQSVEFLTSPVTNDMVIAGARLAHAFVDEDGNPDIDTEGFEGAVYVFRRNFIPKEGADEEEEPEYEWIPQKLVSVDPQNSGWFGESVAAYGNTLVVGAPREGMEDPDDPDSTLQAVGFVHMFTYDLETEQWSEFSELLMPYGPFIMQQFDQFGLSVAINGNVTAVGAPGMNWLGVDQNGDPLPLNSVGQAFTYGRCFNCVTAQDCFEVGFSAGCNISECCNRVCQFDPYCCSTEWDERCVDLAMMFPEDCGVPPTPNCPAFGSCCDFRATPGCSSQGCCEVVCIVDPFCCEDAWDPCCVSLAGELCGNLCPDAEPSCEGFCGFEDADGCSETCSCAADCIIEDNCCPDVCTQCRDEEGFEWCPPIPDCPGIGSCCEAGPDLGCEDETCCMSVCTARPECCIDGWDECCVALAAELCDGACPDQRLSCEERCGEADLDGCGVCSCASNCVDFDNCCEDVCDFCSEEPDFEWCPGEPPISCPATGSCCSSKETPGCENEDCCIAVCAVDVFCCELVWDECCARLAEDLCLVCPPTAQPSCEGLCGEVDPDGCGVCSCSPDCFFFGDCCGDVCEHCGNEEGFSFCPDELPEENDQPDAKRPAPRPVPPFGDSPRADLQPIAPLRRTEDVQPLIEEEGVSTTAPKRR